MALAAEFDDFLIDLDGGVWGGREMQPGAAEALRGLQERGLEIVFITNNPGKPSSSYAERLREAGVEIDAGRVVTAGESTARLAAASGRAGEGGFGVGGPAFKQTVAAAGVAVLDGETGSAAGLVVVSGHREFDYAELLTATRALQGGAALLATSRDPTLPMPGGAWPGTGAILAAGETATRATAEIGGKPEPHLFELARERIAAAERGAVVGGRGSSALAGGGRGGVEAGRV